MTQKWLVPEKETFKTKIGVPYDVKDYLEVIFSIEFLSRAHNGKIWLSEPETQHPVGAKSSDGFFACEALVNMGHSFIFSVANIEFSDRLKCSSSILC